MSPSLKQTHADETLFCILRKNNHTSPVLEIKSGLLMQNDVAIVKND